MVDDKHIAVSYEDHSYLRRKAFQMSAEKNKRITIGEVVHGMILKEKRGE